MPRRVVIPMIEAVLMMRPKPWLSMTGAAWRASTNSEVRFVSMIRSHCAMECSATGLRVTIPALLTRMSRRPCSPTIPSTAAGAASLSVTSNCAVEAASPACASCACVAASASPFTSASTTCAPASARARAIWRPRPPAAPVTRATRPSSLKSAPISAFICRTSLLLMHRSGRQRQGNGSARSHACGRIAGHNPQSHLKSVSLSN